MTSIKQEIIEYLQRLGYKFDLEYDAHHRKYRKLTHDQFVPIYVGNAGGFRRGHTLKESKSITDDLRARIGAPQYGDSEEYYRQAKLKCQTCNGVGCPECSGAGWSTIPRKPTLAFGPKE